MAKPCSVLIVEDEPLIGEIFESVLVGEGCEVRLAADAVSMRDACAAGAFDVAVLDIALPGGVTGMDLAREAAAAGCGVILITGHPIHYDAVVKSGYPHLFKPFRVEALVQMVYELLQASDAGCTMKERRRHP